MDRTTGQEGKSRDSPAKPCTGAAHTGGGRGLGNRFHTCMALDSHSCRVGRWEVRYGVTHVWILDHTDTPDI